MSPPSDAPGRRVPWLAYACLAGSMALVGCYVGLSKLLVAVLPVFLLAWLRFGIAAVAMAGWVRRVPGEAPLSAADRRLLFWESFLGNFLFSICMLYGVSMTSALSAGVMMAAIPGVVALMAWMWLGESITGRTVAGVLLAGAGVALLAWARAGGSVAGGFSVTGHLLLAAAVVCEAAYVVIGKRLSGTVAPRRISALINLWGFALVTPLGLWQATRFDFASVPPSAWGLLVFYALAASVVTVWLWMRGLQQVPAPQAGVFSVMLPVAAAAVGIGVLGEPFGPWHAAALAAALGGVLLATWPARHAPR
jgi:drug/metabolite transporter (DMT)-like permease